MRSRPRPASLLATLACVAALLAAAGPRAAAAVPGANGRIAWTSNATGNRDVWSMQPNGSDKVDVTSNPAMDAFPSWSPDGERIAFTSGRRNKNWDLYAMDADGSHVTPLTANSNAFDWLPAWSPDGTRIAFTRNRDGDDAQLWIMNADGTGASPLAAANSLQDDALPVWSPDGAEIAFRSNRTGDWEIFLVAADGSSPPMDVTNDPSDDRAPSWSPNGQRIAFKSKRTGNFEIYTMAPDGSDLVRVTRNNANDEYPSWSPDGTRLAFQSGRDGNQEIYTMDADGTNVERLTEDPALPAPVDFDPDWQAVSPGPGADLSVTAVARPRPAQVDDPMRFEYAVTDNGPGGSSDATLTDGLPPNLVATSTSPSQGSCSGTATVACHLGPLAPGQTATVTIDVAASAPGDTDTSASVRGPEPDPLPSNDRARATTVIVGSTHEDGVTLGTAGFVPADVAVPELGGEVVFTLQETGRHTVTDRSGMSLFDSGTLVSGSTFRLVMTQAGGYPYRCRLHPTTEIGIVRAPMSVSPSSGGPSSLFSVRWALADPAPGTWFDVQVRPPDGTFADWDGHAHETGRSAQFLPDHGAGTYLFRVRAVGVAGRSYWSSPAGIEVS